MRSDLQTELDRMLESLRRARQELAEIQHGLGEVEGCARSSDNLVACTVSAGTGLTDLEISPRAMQRYDASQLAATIVKVIHEASADLNAQIAELYRDVLGDHFHPEALADPSAASRMVARLQQTALGAHTSSADPA